MQIAEEGEPVNQVLEIHREARFSLDFLWSPNHSKVQNSVVE
jgi:hypothetical protein